MKRIYFTLEDNTPLVIMPDITSHMDGHPVFSLIYHLFLNVAGESDQYTNKEYDLTDKDNDPDYYGYIIFEKPGQLFSYYEGRHSLTRSQVEEVIEYISHVRDSPDSWKIENL